MLERLTLRDFQTHKKLVIDLDPRITTVVGPSDQGKSAVIRALRWLCFNRPTGDAFIRHGTDSTKVSLTVDGREIRRSKGKAGNTYHIDQQPLKAFGADVPEEVAKLLNLGDVNFQGQHDAPFWFSETAGGVSKALNAIINLGDIDRVSGYLNSKLREYQATQSAAEQRVATTKVEWLALKPLKEIDKELQAVEALSTAHRAAGTRALLGHDLVQEAQGWGVRTERAAAGHQGALLAIAAGDQWQRTAQARQALVSLVTQAKGLEQTKMQAVPDPTPLVALWDRKSAAAARAGALAGLVAEARRQQGRVREAKSASETAEKQFHKLMGKVCPLCGNQIGKLPK